MNVGSFAVAVFQVASSVSRVSSVVSEGAARGEAAGDAVGRRGDGAIWRSG